MKEKVLVGIAGGKDGQNSSLFLWKRGGL